MSSMPVLWVNMVFTVGSELSSVSKRHRHDLRLYPKLTIEYRIPKKSGQGCNRAGARQCCNATRHMQYISDLFKFDDNG